MKRIALPFPTGALALGILLSACGGGAAGRPPSLPDGGSAHHRTGSTPIQHIVLIIQENRTFNNLFAGFPGATSSKTGWGLILQGSQYVRKKIKLKKVPLTDHGNVTHLYKAFLTGCDYQGSPPACQMDGFNLIRYVRNGKPEGRAPYQYVNPKYILPYWTIAEQWGLANAMFQSQGSDSFTAHQELIRGGTCIASCLSSSAATSLIDPPTTSAAWGCDSNQGAKTWLIVNGQISPSPDGPFPCSKYFPNYGSNGYETLRDLLDAKSVSWKYYTPIWKSNTPSALWDAFDVIAPVRYGPEWTDGHISSPETTIFNDISGGTLPAMSWVIPSAANSDHPGYSQQDTGPSWVASVVNAIGNSSYWNSTAVIVVWDDWGGFYDPVPPPSPPDLQGGPGFRVPMLVVSPYAIAGSGSQGGYISNTTYEFASIIRFIEDNWNLGRIPGTPDATSTSIGDMFNVNQSPRQFTTIPSQFKKTYFLHQKPSELPVDTE